MKIEDRPSLSRKSMLVSGASFAAVTVAGCAGLKSSFTPQASSGLDAVLQRGSSSNLYAAMRRAGVLGYSQGGKVVALPEAPRSLFAGVVSPLAAASPNSCNVPPEMRLHRLLPQADCPTPGPSPGPNLPVIAHTVSPLGPNVIANITTNAGPVGVNWYMFGIAMLTGLTGPIGGSIYAFAYSKPQCRSNVALIDFTAAMNLAKMLSITNKYGTDLETAAQLTEEEGLSLAAFLGLVISVVPAAELIGLLAGVGLTVTAVYQLIECNA